MEEDHDSYGDEPVEQPKSSPKRSHCSFSRLAIQERPVWQSAWTSTRQINEGICCKYLASLTDEERIKYFEGMTKADIWKVAEGNPANNTDLTTGGQPIEAIIGMHVMKDGA